MANIVFKGKPFVCDGSKSMLDSALSQKVFMPYSCKEGVCHACIVKAVKGTPPPASQQGLEASRKQQNIFLACQCFPEEDMVVEAANFNPTYSGEVLDKTWLNQDVMRLCLVRPDGFAYQAGQYINIERAESQLIRSYSLASLPNENFMELHIKRYPDGRMSGWLCDDVALGQTLTFTGGFGECFYQRDKPEQDIILAGVGTGLAPLYGILREALEQSHQGNIHLFHASLNASGLYYQDEIHQLVEEVANLHYIPCVLNGEAPQGGKQGAVDQIMIDTLGDCTGKRAYLCGDDAVVQAMKKTLFMHGVAEKDILADAFVASA